MLNRKWLPTLTFAIFLLIPGVALAQPNLGGRPAGVNQRNDRSSFIVIPRNDGAGFIVIQRNDKVGVVAATPRNGNEFERVYKVKPNRNEVVDMLETRRRVAQLDKFGLKVQPDARTRKGLEAYIEQSPEKVFAVVGHNVNGEFRFPDGSTQTLAEIDALAKKHNKLAVHLSCDATDHVHPSSPAATGKLTSLNAIDMATAIGKRFGQDPPSNNPTLRLDDLAGRIQSDINGVERLSAIRTEIKATALVGALGTVYLVEQQRRKTKRR